MTLAYDVARLRAEIPELLATTPRGAESLWGEFSRSEWRAGWIIPDATKIAQFRAWLAEHYPAWCMHEHVGRFRSNGTIAQCLDCKLVGAAYPSGGVEWPS